MKRTRVPDEIMEQLAERSGGMCEARLEGCSGQATEPHHRLIRKHGGPDTLENLVHVDRLCHRYIHDHPAESYESGNLVHSYCDEARALRGETLGD